MFFNFWSFPPSNELFSSKKKKSNELLDCFLNWVMWNLDVLFFFFLNGLFLYWCFLNFGFLQSLFQNSAELDTFQNWVLGHFSAITDRKKKISKPLLHVLYLC